MPLVRDPHTASDQLREKVDQERRVTLSEQVSGMLRLFSNFLLSRIVLKVARCRHWAVYEL